MQDVDLAVLVWLQGHASPWLDQRALEVTALGDGYVVAVLVVSAGALLWAFGARVYAGCLAAAAAGAAVLTPILKTTFERERPDAVELRALFPETSYAYPSGHALLSTATIFVLAYVIHRIARRTGASIAIAILATIAIALTGLSRLYLGVHYPSDVIAGHALGVAWGALCITVAERLRTRIGESIPCLGGAMLSPEPPDTNRMTRPAFVLVAVLGAIAACADERPANAQQLAAARAPVRAPSACTVTREATALPEVVRETSGLARGSAGFWTHNDKGNDAVLFRIDERGELAQTVALEGATLVDWEDIDAARCGDGTCLFVGDIGDNDAERSSLTVYRVPEPEASARSARPDGVVQLRYPDGARDAESLFVAPDGTLFVVTKGRREPISLYRASNVRWQGETVALERVRELFPRPSTEDDRVTSATISPDGRWVAVRSYADLYVYPFAALVAGGSVTPARFDISRVGETQGEAVVLGDDGSVWLTSEAENRNARPSWVRLDCELPD